MPLYNPNGSNMPQMAQSAMNSATSAMANQQKQTTTTTKKESNFWDDLYKGAKAVQAGAQAVNSIAGAVDKGVKLYDDLKIKSAYDDMNKIYAEQGIEGLRSNPDFQDYHHAQALGMIMKDRAATSKGQLDMRNNALKIAEQNYNDVRAVLMPGLDAYKKGDMETFSSSMVNASQLVNMPYRIEPDGNGAYKVFFRSNDQNGWTDTGRTMSPEEVYAMGQNYLKGEVGILSGLGMKITPYNREQIFEGARRAMLTNDINAETLADPSRHKVIYDANGKRVGTAIPQNTFDGRLNTQFMTYGADGKYLGTMQAEDIYKRGLTLGNMQIGAARGRGGGRSGSTGAAKQTTGQGNFGVSSNGAKIFTDVCTTTGEDGNKFTNYSAVAGLKALRMKYGIGEEQLAGAYQQATSRGMSPDQAIRAIGQQLEAHISRKNKETAGIQSANTQSQNQQQSQKSQPASPIDERIKGAAAGKSAPARQEAPAYPEDLGSVGAAQHGAYKIMRGIGNYFNDPAPVFDYPDDPWSN